MIISIDAEKVFNKIQHPFMKRKKKKLFQTWAQKNLNILKDIYDKRASLVAQLIKNPPATLVQFLGWEDPQRRDRLPTPVFLGFPGGSAVKNLPSMWETWVQSLGWEDPLKKEIATHSSILAWRIL